MTHPFAEQIALVTGANDPEGLGFGIATELIAGGATVYFGCRLQDQVEALAAPLNTFGPSARPVLLDVSDPAGIPRAFQRIESEAGRLDILVNNAGDGANCSALDETAGQWDRIMTANARGPFLCSQAAAQLMLPRQYGRIVNISSQAATVAILNHVAYSSSKAALNMLTKSMALEWAPLGITVNAVAPTYLMTPGTRPFLEQPEFRKSVLARIPVGRVGSIHDIAHAVRFLCHPDSSLITGEVLMVDGGWTLA
ncbi:MAG: SDR family oxidoreductase [Verrucomicrobia bacterium]|nr:SDR family oxidoreductase [Verrucomicrobiota bacterium]